MDIVKLVQNVEDYLHWATEANDAGTKQQTYQEFVRNMYNITACLVGTQAIWQPVTDYTAGRVIISPNMPVNSVAYVETSGTTGNVEPEWGDIGESVQDGTAKYTMKRRILDFATQAEVDAGTVNNKIVTPATLKNVTDNLSSDLTNQINSAKSSANNGISGLETKIDSDAGLWDYLHRKGGNFAIPTTNAAINALGMFLSYYTSNVIAHQPSRYGQLFNIPATRAGAEATQLWFEQDSGRMWHRGGNGSDIVNNQAFLRFLDESDLTNINNNVNGRGVIAGNVSNANSWWVKLGGTIPLIIQGGISGSPVTFPIAFSTLICILTNVYDSHGGDVGWYEWQVTNCTRTGFSFGKPGIRRYWLAMGY